MEAVTLRIADRPSRAHSVSRAIGSSPGSPSRRRLSALCRLLTLLLLVAQGTANFAHRHSGQSGEGPERAVVETGHHTCVPAQPPGCLACQYLGSAGLPAASAPATLSGW